MVRSIRFVALALSLVAASSLVGCAEEHKAAPSTADTSGTETDDVTAGTVGFTVLDGIPQPAVPAGVTVLRSHDEYASFFHAEPPKGFSFNKSWVVYTSIGLALNGGYSVSVTKITKSGSGADKVLVVDSTEVRPGPGCIVSHHTSNPGVAVRINKQPDTHGVEQVATTNVTDCGQGGEACGKNTCGAGEKCCSPSCGICEPQNGACPAIACQTPPVTPPAGEACGKNTCGAGEKCCSASCGICEPANGLCPAIECGGPVDGETCGGIAGIQCAKGQTCVDDPSDGCDPKHGGADCSGICQAN